MEQNTNVNASEEERDAETSGFHCKIVRINLAHLFCLYFAFYLRTRVINNKNLLLSEEVSNVFQEE